MARRKESLKDIYFDTLEAFAPIYILYLVVLWFTNKANFWRWVIYGFVALMIPIGITIFWKRAKFKKGKR